VQVRVRGVDEDRDRRQLDDARWPSCLRFAQDRLLGDLIGLRIEPERRRELDETIGGPVLVLVELGEQRVRFDARGVELDGAPQVRLGGGGVLAMDLGEPEAHAQVVSVARRRPHEQAFERRDGGVGVAAGEGDLAGQEQGVGLIVGWRLRHGPRAFQRPARLIGVAGAQGGHALTDPVVRARRLAGRFSGWDGVAGPPRLRRQELLVVAREATPELGPKFALERVRRHSAQLAQDVGLRLAAAEGDQRLAEGGKTEAAFQEIDGDGRVGVGARGLVATRRDERVRQRQERR